MDKLCDDELGVILTFLNDSYILIGCLSKRINLLWKKVNEDTVTDYKCAIYLDTKVEEDVLAYSYYLNDMLPKLGELFKKIVSRRKKNEIARHITSKVRYSPDTTDLYNLMFDTWGIYKSGSITAAIILVRTLDNEKKYLDIQY